MYSGVVGCRVLLLSEEEECELLLLFITKKSTTTTKYNMVEKLLMDGIFFKSFLSFQLKIENDIKIVNATALLPRKVYGFVALIHFNYRV